MIYGPKEQCSTNEGHFGMIWILLVTLYCSRSPLPCSESQTAKFWFIRVPNKVICLESRYPLPLPWQRSVTVLIQSWICVPPTHTQLRLTDTLPLIGIIIISSFLYGALNIHLYALYKQTVEWGKHSSIVLKSNTQLATAPTVYDVTFHFWNIASVWIDEF